MGRDLPARSRQLQVSKSDETKIEDTIHNEDKLQFKNDSSHKGRDCKSISHVYGNNSAIKSILGYDEGFFCNYTQKNNQKFISDDKQSLFTENNNRQDSLRVQKHSAKIITDGNTDSELKSEQTKHGSDNTYSEDICTLGHIEKFNSEIDLGSFQKKDYCSRQLDKIVTSSLDKCSWHGRSEQEVIDETSLVNEDDDTTEEDISTIDISSEGTDDIGSESCDSQCDEISIIEASDASGSESNEDGSSSNDDCNNDIEEIHEDGICMLLVGVDQQEAPIGVLINIVEEIDQQPEVANEDAIVDTTEDSSSDVETDNELFGEEDQTTNDVVPQQNKLVMQTFSLSINTTTPAMPAPTDLTVKHSLLIHNEYNTEIAGEATNLVVVNNVHLDIPQIQDNANPLLPVQPRDGQPLPNNHLGINHTDSVEQDDLLPMCNSSLLVSLESPRVMTEESLIHSFSTSSENLPSQYWNIEGAQEEMSDFTETESEDCEQSDNWLSSMSDLAANVDDLYEHFDINLDI